MRNVIRVMLAIYVVLFFIALFSLSGCSPYRSKERSTTIKAQGEEFKLVDDEIYPDNIYNVKVVHITI